MPIYSYKCKNCGKIFDRFQKIGGKGTEYCDLCNSEAFRVFSPVGIIFKGSGFYSTDYKSGSNKSITGSKTSAAENKQETKIDTRTEKPAENKGKIPAATEKCDNTKT